MQTYEEKKQRLTEEMRGAGGAVVLGKKTSNLFRHRTHLPKRTLNVRDFHSVLSVNAEERWVEVEGMTTYEELTKALLPMVFMPAVVPQLKSITIGGAVSGVGIEATSFRHGLVHETILSMDVLLADGSVVTCTPTNENSDLFFGLSNSYGTLGYILKLRARILPIRPFVHVRHRHFTDPLEYFSALGEACRSDADFIDGAVFSRGSFVLSMAKFVDDVPSVSDYTYRNIYYKSLLEKSEDFLTSEGYIWRWDTDWFWCSRSLGFEHPLVRLLAGRRLLNSVTYTKIMRWNSRLGLMDRLHRLTGTHAEAVIQDILIPLGHAPEFLEFLLSKIDVLPIWICPVRPETSAVRYPLFPLEPNTLGIDFGFWGIKKGRVPLPRGYYNRMVEEKTRELRGTKSLYSEAFYPREEFWSIYNGEAYERLKDRYDPERRLRDLYEKCVLSR